MPIALSSQVVRRLHSVLLTVAFLSLAPVGAVAQTVTDPRIVTFSPSTDDSATLSDGRPVVDHYELGFYSVGASQPFQLLDLGKPAPGTDGTIQVDFVHLVQSLPVPGVLYESRVSAVGPVGAAISSPSNTFTFTGPCTYSVSTPPSSIAASGGSGNVSVTSGADCSWSASTPANWLGLSNGGGTGTGSVSYTIVPNLSASPRSTSFTVAGQTFTVTQAGAGCTYSATPWILSFAAAGGAGSASVTAGAGCSWSTSSSATWIKFGAAGGLSSGSVSYTVSANPSTSPRSGSITVAGSAFTISQAASSAPTTVALGKAVDMPVRGDYDGDGRTDPAVFGKMSAIWKIRRSTDGVTFALQFGAPILDTPVPADYDGDGKTDIAIFRKKTAQWFVRRSSDLGLTLVKWGAFVGDTPVPADYDGDGKADFAVFASPSGIWRILRSSDGGTTTQQWGAPTPKLKDVPVQADYDGDHKADISVYRASSGTWYIRRSSDGGLTSQAWGSPATADAPIQADYNGDGKADLAIFRKSTSQWIIASSVGSATITSLGIAGDLPVPGPYEGGANARVAVWRPSTGVWRW